MAGDNISTVEGIQYCGGYLQCCGGIKAVHWGIPSVLWRLFNTVGDNISTVGDNFSTVEGIQYIGGITSVHAGDNISTVWDNISSVQWGIPSVQWGDNISTVEVAQYSGDKDLKYYEFSKNLEIFSRAYFASKSDRPHHRTQLLTTADMVKDLGYKNLVLGKILL